MKKVIIPITIPDGTNLLHMLASVQNACEASDNVTTDELHIVRQLLNILHIQNYIPSRHYFLFGGVVSDWYFEYSFDELLAKIQKCPLIDACLFEWDVMEGGSNLLSAFDGWGGFAQITEEEFHKLSELIEIA